MGAQRKRQAVERREEVASGLAAPRAMGRPAAVLRLQASAGNRAVAQRLGDGSGGPAHGGCAGVAVSTFEDQAPAGGAVPLSAGGKATQQLGWGDFADGSESETFDALTSYALGYANGVYSAAFDQGKSWAKPSVKSGNAALLRHEQYHLDLAVLMAAKATAAGPPTSQGLTTLIARTENQRKLYDDETGSSANAGPQAAWEARIDAGTVPYA